MNLIQKITEPYRRTHFDFLVFQDHNHVDIQLQLDRSVPKAHFGLDAHLAKPQYGWIHCSCYCGAEHNQGTLACDKNKGMKQDKSLFHFKEIN